MPDDQLVLRHTSPGWAALLPGFIPALLFVLVHGTRRSYELLQATAFSFRESAALLVITLEMGRAQLLLGLVTVLVAGSLLGLAVRRQLRVRRTHRARLAHR